MSMLISGLHFYEQSSDMAHIIERAIILNQRKKKEQGVQSFNYLFHHY